jgi:hypothetical protein
MQSTAMADVFVSSGLVSEEQLSQALDKQRQLKTQEPIGDAASVSSGAFPMSI